MATRRRAVARATGRDGHLAARAADRACNAGLAAALGAGGARNAGAGDSELARLLRCDCAGTGRRGAHGAHGARGANGSAGDSANHHAGDTAGGPGSAGTTSFPATADDSARPGGFSRAARTRARTSRPDVPGGRPDTAGRPRGTGAGSSAVSTCLGPRSGRAAGGPGTQAESIRVTDAGPGVGPSRPARIRTRHAYVVLAQGKHPSSDCAAPRTARRARP